MPIFAIDWEFGRNTRVMRDGGEGSEARLDVLINLLSHANARLRAWPSVETIMEETGFSKPIVSSALGWLFEHGAIYNVPPALRTGIEAKLSSRKYVFQLTCIIEIKGRHMMYVFLKPEEKAWMIDELHSLGANSAIELYGKDSEPYMGKESEPLDGKDSSPLSSNHISSDHESISTQVDVGYSSADGIPDWLKAQLAAGDDTAPADEDLVNHPLVKKLAEIFKHPDGKALPANVIKGLKEQCYVEDSEAIGGRLKYGLLTHHWDTAPGFDTFFEERAKMHYNADFTGAKSMASCLAHIRNFGANNKWKGWHIWREMHKAETTPVEREAPTTMSVVDPADLDKYLG